MSDAYPLVSLERVHKVYLDGSLPVHALHSIDLSVEDGEFVMVTGPSGCGKSSRLNVIAGVGLPTTGRVPFRGRSIASMTDRELSILRRSSPIGVASIASRDGSGTWQGSKREHDPRLTDPVSLLHTVIY